MQIPEYDPNAPTIIREGDVTTSETKWFSKQLERIAGKNPHGKPNLQLVWGVSHYDPMAETPNTIKYLDFKKDGVEYGERRFFIEIWRSPEFLVSSGRYQKIFDVDDVQEFWFCKACDMEVGRTVPATTEGCPKCGAKRFYMREVREGGEGRVLKDFPREGCYDYWLRLERANLTYHPADGEALKVAAALWEWEKMPQNQRDALEQADRELERRQMVLEERRQSGNAPQFGSGIIPVTNNLVTLA